MALTGTPVDLYTKKYSDNLSVELQQRGSILRALCTNVPVEGEATYFRRVGASGAPQLITDRFAPVEPALGTFESRLCTPSFLLAPEFVSELDLMRGSDPRSAQISNLRSSLGRGLDTLILSALGGLATRTVDGTAGTVSFDSNNTVAVNSEEFVASAGNFLTESKLMTARKILGANHVELSDLVVVSTSFQQLKLLARLTALGINRQDMTGKLPLMMPGVDSALTGFMGMTFITYEPLGDAANLTSGDQYAYVFPRTAINLGIWEDLKVEINQDKTRADNPFVIKASIKAGAVRMDEKQVVRLICDV